MCQGRLSERERVARLLGGGIITGITLSGGLRNRWGKTLVASLAMVSVFEGIVNTHLIDYFHLNNRRH